MHDIFFKPALPPELNSSKMWLWHIYYYCLSVFMVLLKYQQLRKTESEWPTFVTNIDFKIIPLLQHMHLYFLDFSSSKAILCFTEWLLSPFTMATEMWWADMIIRAGPSPRNLSTCLIRLKLWALSSGEAFGWRLPCICQLCWNCQSLSVGAMEQPDFLIRAKYRYIDAFLLSQC